MSSFKKFQLHLPHYFSKHPSRDLKELFWSVGLMDLGIASVTLFEPIFLYTAGYSLKHIVFFYFMVYALYSLFLPFIGRWIGRIGYEHSIFYSQFFLIAYYLALFAIPAVPIFFYLAPFMYALQKSLYWPAYHADFAEFSSTEQRGREVGGIESLHMIVFIVGPFIGGAILEWTNFSVLFIVVSVFFIMSAFPLLRIKEIYSPVKFSYAEVFRELWDSQHRRNFLAYMGFGEELIVLTLWPIFIYLVVTDYLKIGTIVAFATLVTGFLILYVGRAADRYRKENILRFGSILYFISWIIRGFATKVWHVFSLDTLSRFSKEALFVPLVAMTYNQAKKYGVLSYTVFYEQSIAVAKCLTAAALILIVHYFASPWVPMFVLAGVCSLMYMFMKDAT
ncbi:MAG: MFS transporter [Patescibacteria group bacterium]